MAYPSTHTGSEIDQAVEEVINRIWQPMSTTASQTGWTTNEDSGHTAAYKIVLTFKNVDKTKSVPPMVWFVSNATGEQGNRFYCDYVSTPVSNNDSYTVTIYSNVQKAGTVYAFGLVPLSQI